MVRNGVMQKPGVDYVLAENTSTNTWQVNFSDWANTSLYVSNIEARVITARSDIWRVFDFLWMLHIMDYDERDDFNNPLVILMATLGLFFVLSGVILVIKGFQRSGTKFIK